MKTLNLFCVAIGLAMLVSCDSDSASSASEENKSDELSSDSNDLSSDSKKVENSSSSKEGDILSSESHENDRDDDEKGSDGVPDGNSSQKGCSDISVVEYSPEYEGFRYECIFNEVDTVNSIGKIDCDYEWWQQACNTDGEYHFEPKRVMYQSAHVNRLAIFHGDTLLLEDGHDAFNAYVGGCARSLKGTWIQLPSCTYKMVSDKIKCDNEPKTSINKLVFTDSSVMVYDINLNPPPNYGAPEDPFNTDFMYNLIYLFRDNPAALVRPREVFQLTLTHGDTLKVYFRDHLVGAKTKNHALFNINGREVDVNIKEYSASRSTKIFSVDVSSNGSVCSGYYEMSYDWEKYCKDEYAGKLIWRERTELSSEASETGWVLGLPYPLEPRPIIWASYYQDDKSTDFEKCMKDMRAAE